MKDLILATLFLLSCSTLSYAQIKTSEVKVEETNGITSISGKVGIGTEAPMDNNVLHVKGQGAVVRFEGTNNGENAASSLLLNVGNTSRAKITWHKIGSSSHLGGLSLGTRGSDGLNDRLFIDADGNVGIGTTNPSAPLEIMSDGTGESLLVGRTNGTASIKASTDGTGHLILDSQPTAYLSLNHYMSANVNLVNGGGNVGIGTTSPTEKLHVNGKIRATGQVGWSDFVFEETYNLPELSEVEAYIAKNGHLKDIPSEEEVIREGYILGDMDARLLQKIEELTLYVIKLNKQVEKLQAENKELKQWLKE